MSTVNGNFSCSPQQPGALSRNISTANVNENVALKEIQLQSTSLAIVPYVQLARIRVKTWANLHSLFTLATLINNVACSICPHPALIGINLALRCGSIAFASYPVGCAPSTFTSYPVNKAKISTDMISIVAILIIKNAAMPIAIASDLAFEAMNFNECKVSRESLQSLFNSFFKKLSSFFKKQEEPPLDINRFVQLKFEEDPTTPDGACRILAIPLNRMNDQAFIDKKFENGDIVVLRRRKKRLEAKKHFFAEAYRQMVDYHETAYRTLKQRNEANLTSQVNC
ncbi:MAG: hypothetical protein ACXWM7_00085 [Parachlamydiaceae bacterium]